MYLLAKRLFDIFFSLIIIIILSPFILLIIVILKFSGEGEVFYLQKRVGYHNRIFKIIKFATMLKNSPNMGTGSLTVRKDPRVLPFGHFLRISKINELPQLFNIVLGDMSFVGPRPLMPVDFNEYEADFKDKIYLSRPGITGIGSIIFRDEQKLISSSDKSPKSYYREDILPAKGALELWYQRNKSFITDINILFLTGWVILFKNSKLPFKLLTGLPKLKSTGHGFHGRNMIAKTS